MTTENKNTTWVFEWFWVKNRYEM